MSPSARLTVLSLFAIVPIPSLTVVIGLISYPETLFGQIVLVCGKLWVLLLPVFWLRVIERRPLQLSSRPGRTALGTGIIVGFLMAIVIVLFYRWLDQRGIDRDALYRVARGVGLEDRTRFWLLAVYWIGVNSLLEEYVWRWFVYRQCRRLFTLPLAVVLSALGFTLHHSIIIPLYFTLPVAIIASGGVFIAGLIWSLIYAVYRDIWSVYMSHVIVDSVLFYIAYQLLFAR